MLDLFNYLPPLYKGGDGTVEANVGETGAMECEGASSHLGTPCSVSLRSWTHACTWMSFASVFLYCCNLHQDRAWTDERRLWGSCMQHVAVTVQAAEEQVSGCSAPHPVTL